jgi:hypothetical protein
MTSSELASIPAQHRMNHAAQGTNFHAWASK